MAAGRTARPRNRSVVAARYLVEADHQQLDQDNNEGRHGQRNITLASRRSNTDRLDHSAVWVADMAETSSRRGDAIVLQKPEPSVSEQSNSAARVHEQLGPAVASRL